MKPGEDVTITEGGVEEVVVIILAYEGNSDPGDTPADTLLPLTEFGSV